MKIKTSELKDAALDWAVDQALGATMSAEDWLYRYKFLEGERYSSDWKHGGPIIEREAITVSQGSPVKGLEWMACDAGSTHVQHGPTYLIAAMRCYVASKLGDEVDVPDELCQA
jgi:hypothetical protein